MRWVVLAAVAAALLGCTETNKWTGRDYKETIQKVVEWAEREQKNVQATPSELEWLDRESLALEEGELGHDDYAEIMLGVCTPGGYRVVYTDTELQLFEGVLKDVQKKDVPYVPFRTRFNTLAHQNTAEGYAPRMTRFYPEAGLWYLWFKDQTGKTLAKEPSLEKIRSEVAQGRLKDLSSEKKFLGYPYWAFMGRESALPDPRDEDRDKEKKPRMGYFSWVENGRYHDTIFDYSQFISHDVGRNGIYVYDSQQRKLCYHQGFCVAAKRDVGRNYVHGTTRWHKVWWREVGPDDDDELTRWCPEAACKRDVSVLGLVDKIHSVETKVVNLDTKAYLELLARHLRKRSLLPHNYIPSDILDGDSPSSYLAEYGAIPFGHQHGKTRYSRVWMTAMPKGRIVSRFRYSKIQEKLGADAAKSELVFGQDVPWVEDASVHLTPDDITRIDSVLGDLLKRDSFKKAFEIARANCEKPPKKISDEIDKQEDEKMVDESRKLRVIDLKYRK